MNIEFEPANSSDGDALAALRVEAMRPSLQAVGRYDPDRARNRFLSTFDPKETQKVMLNGQLAGFFVVRILPDYVFLDHLYIDASKQGHGIGKTVLNHVKKLAIEQSLPIRLCALNESKANSFYLQNGFQELRVEKFDTYYEFAI